MLTCVINLYLALLVNLIQIFIRRNKLVLVFKIAIALMDFIVVKLWTVWITVMALMSACVTEVQRRRKTALFLNVVVEEAHKPVGVLVKVFLVD